MSDEKSFVENEQKSKKKKSSKNRKKEEIEEEHNTKAKAKEKKKSEFEKEEQEKNENSEIYSDEEIKTGISKHGRNSENEGFEKENEKIKGDVIQKLDKTQKNKNSKNTDEDHKQKKKKKSLITYRLKIFLKTNKMMTKFNS